MRPPVLLVGNFLSSVYNRGVCEELAARLAARGWEILTTSSCPGRLARITDMVTTTWKLRRRYQLAHVDVYSGRAFLWAEAVCRTLRAAGKPFILTLHGGNLPRFARRWPGRVRRLLRPAAAVTVPSPYLLEHMKRYRSDLELIPNAVDLSVCPFRLRERPAPALVWLRAFQATYNPVLAPRVLALLLQDFPDARLTMLGPDKGDGSLQTVRRVAEELGVIDRLVIPGRVRKEDVPEWLSQNDIFLNTTNVDNTPLSVQEAMACGLCVVSTDVGGVPYLIEHRRDALLVPPNDATAMAAAVRSLLVEPRMAARLSQHARRKIEAFDWTRLLPRWESLLMTAAANGRGAR